MPDVLKQATVAIEDERFYKHRGVDYEGIIRAAVKNATNKKQKQGGSTLTMQLVRNLYTADTTRSGIEGYERKIREARLARDLEETHSKEWVLGKYLNTVPYGTVGGQTAIGAGAAARLYFDKRVQDLTLREAAMLAGMPQAPSDYSPTGNPDGTTAPPQRGAGQDGRARDDHPRARPEGDGEGPRPGHGPLLRPRPRALRARLREVRADQGVRRRERRGAAASASTRRSTSSTSSGRARRSPTTWRASGRRRRS